MKPETMMIDNVKYVREDAVKEMAVNTNGLEYVVIRTYSAGVHAGYLKRRDGKEVELLNARRLYYWSGAATLSQLSQEGVKNVSKCKFTQEVPSIILTEAIEVLPCTEEARLSTLRPAASKRLPSS